MRHSTKPRRNGRLARATDRGSALIIALFAAVVLSGLGIGLLMLTNTEGAIASNYRAGNQTLYAADAAVERVLADILMTPNWNDILTGATKSGFVDDTLTPTLPSNQLIESDGADGGNAGRLRRHGHIRSPTTRSGSCSPTDVSPRWLPRT